MIKGCTQNSTSQTIIIATQTFISWTLGSKRTRNANQTFIPPLPTVTMTTVPSDILQLYRNLLATMEIQYFRASVSMSFLLCFDATHSWSSFRHFRYTLYIGATVLKEDHENTNSDSGTWIKLAPDRFWRRALFYKKCWISDSSTRRYLVTLSYT
jgi:hypothetical protein